MISIVMGVMEVMELWSYGVKVMLPQSGSSSRLILGDKCDRSDRVKKVTMIHLIENSLPFFNQ